MNTSSTQANTLLFLGIPLQLDNSVSWKADWALLQTTFSCFLLSLHWMVFQIVGSGLVSWAQQRSRTTQCWAVCYLFTSTDPRLQGIKTSVKSNCLHSHDFTPFHLPQCTEENNNAYKFNYLLYTRRFSSLPIKQRVVLYMNPPGNMEQPQLQVWLIADPDCYRWQTNWEKNCEVRSSFMLLLYVWK